MIFQGNLGLDLSIAIPMFLIWIGTCSVAIILISKNKLSKRNSLVIYAISLILGGVLLGGIPNAVLPIQRILSSIGAPDTIGTILPMIIMLTILLIAVLIFGRLFCGFACPLGAMQELASKINFKSKVKEQKNVKYKFDIPLKGANVIRWIFFIILAVSTIMWSFAFLQIINPFTGFKIFLNPLGTVFLIPAIFLGIVLISSIFIYRPWCRLFCPFGTFASLVGLISRGKYVRLDACTDCGLCEQICPTHQAKRGGTKEECYYCNRCVETCPVNAIEFKFK